MPKVDVYEVVKLLLLIGGCGVIFLRFSVVLFLKVFAEMRDEQIKMRNDLLEMKLNCLKGECYGQKKKAKNN